MFILSQTFRIHIEVASETCFWLELPLCSELYQYKPSPALSLPQSGRQGKRWIRIHEGVEEESTCQQGKPGT